MSLLNCWTLLKEKGEKREEAFSLSVRWRGGWHPPPGAGLLAGAPGLCPEGPGWGEGRGSLGTTLGSLRRALWDPGLLGDCLRWQGCFLAHGC